MSSETQKLRSANIWRYSQLNIIHGGARYHTAVGMAPFQYFRKASEVEKPDPDPQGVLAKDILSSAISSARTEVQWVLQLKLDPLTLTCYL